MNTQDFALMMLYGLIGGGETELSIKKKKLSSYENLDLKMEDSWVENLKKAEEISWRNFKKPDNKGRVDIKIDNIFNNINSKFNDNHEEALPYGVLCIDGQDDLREENLCSFIETSFEDLNRDFQAFKKSFEEGNTNEKIVYKIYYKIKYKLSRLAADGFDSFSSFFELIKIRSAYFMALCQAEKKADRPFLLVGLDLSGIQDFVYQIHRSKALKSLKGRSFYLQGLIDAAVWRVLGACGLGPSNIVYGSGGKAFILMGNNPSNIEQLNLIREGLNQHLFEEHDGKISLSLSYVAFRHDNDGTINFDEKQSNPSIKSIWQALNEKLSAEKNKKFKHIILNNFDVFFFPQDEGWTLDKAPKLCAITGKSLCNEQAFKLDDENQGEEDEVLFVCESAFKQLGLAKSLFFSADKSKKYYYIRYKNHDQHSIKVLGKEFIPSDTKVDTKDYGDISFAKERPNEDYLGFMVNPKQDFIFEGEVEGFCFYGGGEDYNPDSLEKMLQHTEASKANKIAILRMDVDNLGQIFINGLYFNERSNRKESLLAYSRLSNEFYYFFAGIINDIRQEFRFKKDENYRIPFNIIYSGGDDLFVLGAWKEVFDFCLKIHQRFNEFQKPIQGKKARVSISSGLVTVAPKFPIAKAAKWAENALAKSKQLKNKNGFTFNQISIPWGEKLDNVLNLSYELKELIEKHDFPRVFLFQILNWKNKSDENKIEWLWELQYQCTRACERYQKKPKIVAIFKAIQKAFDDKKFSYKGLDSKLSIIKEFQELKDVLMYCWQVANMSIYFTKEN